MSLRAVDVSLCPRRRRPAGPGAGPVSRWRSRRASCWRWSGPSGSGKSSLLAVCGGLRTPTSGQIFINGTEITALPAAKLTDVRRDSIGFVFQQSNLVPSLTALDQLLLTVHLRGRRPDRADRAKALAC